MTVTAKSLVPGALVLDSAARQGRTVYEFFIVITTQADTQRATAFTNVNTLLLNAICVAGVDRLELSAWALPCTHYERVDDDVDDE